MTKLWNLPVEPRPVQLEALEKGFGREGFAYFLRQRLGKTWVSYAEYHTLRGMREVDWFFVICPNSLKEQWKEAIEQVDEYTPIRIYDASNKKQTYDYFAKNKVGGVFIINYESIRSFLSDDKWDKSILSRTYLVADESTKIKSPRARTTAACHLMAIQSKYKRILTGKPVANNSGDLWAQLAFIGAERRPFYEFKHDYLAFGGYRGRQFLRSINTRLLQATVDANSYIAPDKYIKGFRPEYEPLRRIHLTGDQAQKYKDMEDDLKATISDTLSSTAPIILTKYLRLQQISSGILGDEDGIQHNIIEPEHNPRLRVLMEIIDNEITHKVIIVCRFRKSIENVVNRLRQEGHECVTLVGGMPSKDIEANKARFNKGSCNILVAQIQVLSFGHTLCGTIDNPCDSVIFYENDFSLINRAQCQSRPENADWDIPISYYDMYASKMDKYIIEALRRKEAFSMALMGYAREHGIIPHLKEHDSAKSSRESTHQRAEAEETAP